MNTNAPPLSPRQLEVAQLVAEGLTDKRIGGRLGIAVATVRVHVFAIAARLGIPAGQNTRVLISQRLNTLTMGRAPENA